MRRITLRRMWKSPERGQAAEGGQGLVELALALPVLLLILLGTVDLGRMFFDYIEMRNAAREAAGYLARHPDEVADAKAKATGHGGLPANAVVTVTCSGSGCTTVGANAEAKAVITSTFTPVATGFLGQFGLGSVSLRAEASMRVLS